MFFSNKNKHLTEYIHWLLKLLNDSEYECKELARKNEILLKKQEKILKHLNTISRLNSNNEDIRIDTAIKRRKQTSIEVNTISKIIMEKKNV